MSRSYRDLRVWARAFELSLETYAATRRFPWEERFGFTSQMRRAAVSVVANIAEGKARYTLGEYLHHLSIASGSLSELETLVLLGRRLDLLSDAESRALMQGASETGSMLARLAHRLRERQPARPRVVGAWRAHAPSRPSGASRT